jgi:exonuclease SbcD
VYLLGWSFPTSSVRTSPLAEGLPDLTGTGPALGVLHCDLDQLDSPYAPVRSTELAGRGVSQWLLGHVHKPTLSEADTVPGYLGSLVGLDPSETGRRGPWLVTVEDDGTLRKRHLPLAPLRWERRDVPLDGLRDARAELPERLLATLRACHAELAGELEQVRALGCRLRLTGRVTAHRELTRALAAEHPTALQLQAGETLLFVAGLEDASVPERNLRLLAQGDEPPALLAADLLALEAQDEKGAELIAAARTRLEQRAAEPNFAVLEPYEAGDAALRDLLLRAGYQALDELLAQREGDA